MSQKGVRWTQRLSRIRGTNPELVGVLEHAHARGQRKLVGYFEAVVEDVGGKYDARKTLESLSAKLRDETDLDALSDDLVGVVREAMQPAHVS